MYKQHCRHGVVVKRLGFWSPPKVFDLDGPSEARERLAAYHRVVQSLLIHKRLPLFFVSPWSFPRGVFFSLTRYGFWKRHLRS